MVKPSSKSNLLYAALVGLALLLLAPYFGLGTLMRGSEPEPPAVSRTRATDANLRRRSPEEPRKAQKSSVPADSVLDDIEAMLGSRATGGDTVAEEE